MVCVSDVPGDRRCRLGRGDLRQRRRRQALVFLTAPREDPAFPELSLRQREVLDLIASGLDNAAIASRLGLAVHTVGNHVL